MKIHGTAMSTYRTHKTFGAVLTYRSRGTRTHINKLNLTNKVYFRRSAALGKKKNSKYYAKWEKVPELRISPHTYSEWRRFSLSPCEGIIGLKWYIVYINTWQNDGWIEAVLNANVPSSQFQHHFVFKRCCQSPVDRATGHHTLCASRRQTSDIIL